MAQVTLAGVLQVGVNNDSTDSTWEPVEHLVEWAASAMVAEFRASQKTYMGRQLHRDEVTLPVMELMQKHHLTRSVEFYVQRYKTEFGGVQDKRLQELHGKEYQDVLRSRRSVPLRMNPESKNPSPEMPEGDEKFRLLVMGHLEPDEWKTGAAVGHRMHQWWETLPSGS